jgi:DNA repair exonuclease SbcCD ATPase subunit
MSTDAISETEAPGEASGRPTLRVQIRLCEGEISRLEDQEGALEAERISRIRDGLDTTFVRSRLSDIHLKLDESRTRVDLLKAEYREKVESKLPEIPQIEHKIKDKKRELAKVGDALGKHLSEASKIVASVEQAYNELRRLDAERAAILEKPNQFIANSIVPAEIRAVSPRVVAKFLGIVRRYGGES